MTSDSFAASAHFTWELSCQALKFFMKMSQSLHEFLSRFMNSRVDFTAEYFIIKYRQKVCRNIHMPPYDQLIVLQVDKCKNICSIFIQI